MVSTDIGVWIGAILTIAVFSFLYKDNMLFRFAEHTVVGAGVAISVIMSVNAIIQIGWTPLSQGNLVYLLAFIGGLLLYTRFIEGYQWLMRYGIAIIIGTSTALATRAIPSAQIIRQLKGSMVPLFVSGSIFSTVSNIIVSVFTFASLSYFIFTDELTIKGKAGDVLQRLGRIALYCALGYYLGNTVQTRYSFVIDRLQFLLITWLQLR